MSHNIRCQNNRGALYSHRALLHGHGEVVEHVRPVGALAVRHPGVLDGHHRRLAAALATTYSSSSAAAVVVFVLNCDLFFESYV